MGIDGEILVAGIIVNAFVQSDVSELIHGALQLPPPESAYRKLAERTIAIQREHDAWQPARAEMMQEWFKVRHDLRRSSSFRHRFVFLNWFLGGLHVLPNAGIIVLSLLYGAEDPVDPFGRTVSIGGMMALDADCNCGNLGTIMGTILVADRIPSARNGALQDAFHTLVEGCERIFPLLPRAL